MEFASGLSLRSDTGEALTEALAAVESALTSAPDLLFVFATQHHRESIEEVVPEAWKAISAGGSLVGCVAQGVVAGSQELEDVPALSLWGAVLPGVEWEACHLRASRIEEGIAIGGWHAPDDPVGAILIADPYTFPAGPFVAGLEESYPGLPVVGGMAMAGPGPGYGRLIHGAQVHREGAVAVVFAGDLEFRTVVSQGCRPVGNPGVVTAVRDNRVLEISGKPALEFLQDLFDELPPAEQQLVRSGLQLGVVVDEYRTDFGRGDFLVRAVVDADPEEGSLTVGEHLAVGQTVQFQVRDPDSADEDLRMLLSSEPPADGVLLFTCNGRGQRFFGIPHHDSALVGEVLEPAAVAGFFAAGELGPVGGANFLHGYTATVAELRPAGA